MGGKQSSKADSGGAHAHAAVAPRVVIKPKKGSEAAGASGDESKADADGPKGTCALRCMCGECSGRVCC